jgi:hypothetical protein
MLLMIVQLLSSSVNVVNPWYVKTLRGFRLPPHYRLLYDPHVTLGPIHVSGSSHQGRNLCPPAPQCPHQGPPLGPAQLVMLMVTRVKQAPDTTVDPKTPRLNRIFNLGNLECSLQGPAFDTENAVSPLLLRARAQLGWIPNV